MRLHHLAIVLGLVGACAKKPAPQAPAAATAPAADPAPAATESAAPTAQPAPAPPAAAGTSRAPVRKGGDPQDGGE